MMGRLLRGIVEAALLAAGLLTVGCGPPPTPAAAPSASEAMPDVVAPAALAQAPVYVEDSLAAVSFRAAVIAALQEAGLTVVDEAGPGAYTLSLTPGGMDLSTSGTFDPEITYSYGLQATVFHGGKLIDQLTSNKSQTTAIMQAVQQTQQTYRWLARDIVRQMLASPKVLALADQAKAPAAVGTNTAASDAQLVAGSPQTAAYAFVVGVERYRDLPAPDGARADALAFAELARTTLGIDGERLRVALDDRATAADLRRGLEWLRESTPAGGRAIFYFSGHGAPDTKSGAAYLVPYDGDALALDASALPLNEVMQEVGAAKGNDKLVVLDSCFSGAGGRSVLPKGTRPLVRVKPSAAPASVALLSASTGAETSGTTAAGDRGLFTSHLVDALGHAEADIDGDARITLAELMQWLEPRVARAAKEAGREQHPRLTLGGLAADGFVVVQGVAKSR